MTFSYDRRSHERVVDAGRSMRHTSRLAITLAVLGVLSGCAILEPRAKEDLSEGYALLYDLASKEKQSSQLSIIKTMSPELKSLLERISETSKVTVKELETLARINPPRRVKSGGVKYDAPQHPTAICPTTFQQTPMTRMRKPQRRFALPPSGATTPGA